MKILFLDVDGVLNNVVTTSHSPCGYIGVSERLIRRVGTIVRETGAAIVLSSDWRLVRDDPVHAADYRYLARKLKFTCALRIMDHTDDIRWSKRGTEIRKYLTEHPGVSDYVILDDLPFRDFYLNGLTKHLVLTDPKLGLTDADVKRAVRILRGEDTEPYDKGLFLID